MDQQYLKLRADTRPPAPNTKYPKIYVCSPLTAPSWNETYNNMVAAQNYAETVMQLFDCRAIAPHGYLPMVVDDNDEQERAIALEFGIKMLLTCDAIIICGNRITSGMAGEIEAAKQAGIRILFLEDFV